MLELIDDGRSLVTVAFGAFAGSANKLRRRLMRVGRGPFTVNDDGRADKQDGDRNGKKELFERGVAHGKIVALFAPLKPGSAWATSIARPVLIISFEGARMSREVRTPWSRLSPSSSIIAYSRLWPAPPQQAA